MRWGRRGGDPVERLVAAELEVERLRDLLRDLVATHRLTNRYGEALLLAPADLWLDVCQAAGVEPTQPPGGGQDSAVGDAAGESAAAGDDTHESDEKH